MEAIDGNCHDAVRTAPAAASGSYQNGNVAEASSVVPDSCVGVAQNSEQLDQLNLKESILFEHNCERRQRTQLIQLGRL